MHRLHLSRCAGFWEVSFSCRISKAGGSNLAAIQEEYLRHLSQAAQGFDKGEAQVRCELSSFKPYSGGERQR